MNFFPLNFWFVTNTREVMEHFKLVFGSGNSDLAKIRPLKNWHSPDFLSGFALWLMGFCLGAGPVCVYSAISNMSWTKKSSLRLSLVLMLLCAASFISNLYTHPTHVYTIYSPPGAPRVLACALAFPPLLRSSLLAFRAPGVWIPLSWLLVLYFNFK